MAPELETKSLRLVPHAPEHLRALIEGNDSYERSSGLTPAKGLRDFIVSDDVSPGSTRPRQKASPSRFVRRGMVDALAKACA